MAYDEEGNYEDDRNPLQNGQLPVALQKACVHYCPIGGHLWSHTMSRDDDLISTCRSRFTKGENEGQIRFFTNCWHHYNLTKGESSIAKKRKKS